MEFILADLTFTHEFVVLDTASVDIIIGQDFMSKNGMDLLNTRNAFTLRDRPGREFTFFYPRPSFPVNNLTPRGESESDRLDQLLDEFNDVVRAPLGRTHLVQHEIKLKDDIPIKVYPYSLSPKKSQALRQHLLELKNAGLIRPSKSPYSSPFFVKFKPNGAVRLLMDYRALNLKTIKDAFPTPRLHTILRKLKRAAYISTMDIEKGYYQIELSPESAPLTAFACEDELYEWVMPFGLTTAPATFNRLMRTVFEGILEHFVHVYFDDITVFSSDFDSHLSHLREVLTRLRSAGLTINRDKCQFGRARVKLFGHIVSEDGIEKDTSYVKALDFPRPLNKRQLLRFLGMTGWYRQFVPAYATIAEPLYRLTKTGVRFAWSDPERAAFESLKSEMLKHVVLAMPDYNRKFGVRCDASDVGIGAVLYQTFPEGERMIASASRVLKTAEKAWTTSERE